MNPSRPEVTSGVSVTCGSVDDDLGGQMEGVDQDVLSLTRMSRHALDGHRGLVRRECLVDDLAELGAVQCVGDVGPQITRQIGVHAAADLLVRRETDPDRAVGEVRVLQQMTSHDHDDGDAGLVVGTEQGGPAGGDDVLAALRCQIGELIRREHLVRVIGQGDVPAVVVAMDDRLDTSGVETRRRIDVGQKSDGGDIGRDRRRNRGQHRTVAGQCDIVRADRAQFVRKEPEQVVLFLGAW